MKMKKNLLFLFIPILLSCQKAPKCDEEGVNSTVIEICKQRLRYEIAYEKYYEEKISFMENSYLGREFAGMLSDITSGTDLVEKSKQEAKNDIKAIIIGEKKAEKKYLFCINYADSVVSSYHYYIDNLRASKINNEIKRCDCEANLFIVNTEYEEKDTPIKFYVQYLEDGETFVKVHFED